LGLITGKGLIDPIEQDLKIQKLEYKECDILSNLM
jgi:hypothetical protein